jgi:hypothetical protein
VPVEYRRTPMLRRTIDAVLGAPAASSRPGAGAGP